MKTMKNVEITYDEVRTSEEMASSAILPSYRLRSSSDVSISSLNRANWFSCYINLTSTIVGAGILGLPYAFSKTGWIFGTFLLFISSIISGFGVYLLSKCATVVSPPSSFAAVGEVALPNYSYIIDISVAVKCLGVATSYLIVIGDSLPKAMDQLNAPPFLRERITCLFIGYMIVTPLSFFSKFDSLKFSSSLSAVMIIYLIVLIFLYSLGLTGTILDPCVEYNPGACKGEEKWFSVDLEALRVFSIILLSYSCQQNTFNIVNELRRPTQSRVNSIIVFSLGTALVVYIIVAFCGYATFGDHLQADVLTMYPGRWHTHVLLFMVLQRTRSRACAG